MRFKNGVPFDLYFKHVDRHLNKHPHAKILLCSDSQTVIEECKKKYQDKIITYDATRSEYGELHNKKPWARKENKGKSFSKYKLGEDVIVEAYLLSSTDFFIHGNSAISNFILCYNPNLKHDYIFEKKDKHVKKMFKIWYPIMYAIYDLSAKLKKHSKTYSKLIDLIKGKRN